MAHEILGRIWFYGDGEHDVEVWHHALEPTDPLDGRRSIGEWARGHFCECYDDKSLRELFKVPAEGDFQCLFKGTLDGAMSGGAPWDAQEWDEWFDVEVSEFQAIPEEYVNKVLCFDPTNDKEQPS